MANKNILLIEPAYKNKYPPLGLMKIAQYHGPLHKKDNVKFIKGDDISVIGQDWDRVYVTTLFSFEWEKISKSIDFAIYCAFGQTNKVFVGGIAASLMNDRFASNPKWSGVRFIKGLLKESPAESLHLEDELYSDDNDSTPIEDMTPDYSILDQINYKYPVRDAYFSYASRGCIRSCKFCGVPKLEGEQRDTYSVSRVVSDVSKLYGEKKDLILMDNNVVASPRFKEIIAEIKDSGFEHGSKIRRGKSVLQRRVDFNQGVDARILAKNPMYLNELSKICIKPLRIAFDHLGLKKPYELSIRYAADSGLNYLSNYMLYNFYDTPADLFERMRLNVDLKEELKINIFSFPMRYQPTDQPDRSHIGPKWNSYHLRSMRMILQATHGVVSGRKDFFTYAFGDTYSDFSDIINMPHHYILNRKWYDTYDGKQEFEEFQREYRKLSDSQRNDLLDFLCSTKSRMIANEKSKIIDPQIRNISEYYIPLSMSQEKEIWSSMKQLRQNHMKKDHIPEDELVEDADLNDEPRQLDFFLDNAVR